MNKRVDFLRGQEKRDRPLITVKKPAFDSPAKSRESSTTSRGISQTAVKQQSLARKSSESIAAGPSSLKGKEKQKDISPRRSPTPPVVDATQEMKGGKYRFSEEESKFMIKYARYRLSLDPDVSKSAICQGLNKKVRFEAFCLYASSLIP